MAAVSDARFQGPCCRNTTCTVSKAATAARILGCMAHASSAMVLTTCKQQGVRAVQDVHLGVLLDVLGAQLEVQRPQQDPSPAKQTKQE